VSARSAVNPGSTASTRARPCATSPTQISSAIDPVTCTATNVRWTRPARRVPVSDRVVLPSEAARSRVADQAGTTPQMIAAAVDVTIANITTRVSTAICVICGKSAGPNARHAQARHAPAERQSRCLEEQLSRDAGAQGAERRSKRELRPPSRGAHQKQIREIATADEQQHRYSAKQRPEQAGVVADDLALERVQADPDLPRIVDGELRARFVRSAVSSANRRSIAPRAS
jgi:hypothetical protein